MIAAGTRDGRIVLFDTTLSAPIASVKVADATFSADALAFFQEYSAPPADATAAQAPAQPAGGRGFGAAAPGIPMIPGQHGCSRAPRTRSSLSGSTPVTRRR